MGLLLGVAKGSGEPPRVAGTLFAILRALGNLGTMFSRWLCGVLYE